MSIDDDGNEPRLRGTPEAQSSVDPPAHPAPPALPAGVSPPPRPPAWRLNPYGSPPPTQRGAGSGVQVPAPRSSPFEANFLLRLAQLLAVVQGAMGVVTGINLIRGAATLRDIAAGVNLSGASLGTAVGYGIATVAIAALVIIAGILTGRPSTIARVVVGLWAFVAFWVSLAAFYRGGSVLGFVTVVVFAATGGAILPAAAVLSIDAIIFYALALHPATYRAFAERGGAASWNIPPVSPRHSPPTPPAAIRSASMPSGAGAAPAPARARSTAPATPPQAESPAATHVPPASPHEQQAAALEQPALPRATPRKRLKLPTSRRPPAPAAPTSERSTRAQAPSSQSHDYSPPRGVNDDEDGRVDPGVSSKEGESSG